MWILRWIVLLLIIVVVLTFSLQNQNEVVVIKFMNWESNPVPLYITLFVAFGFGMVSFLLIAVFQQLQTLSDLSRTKRKFKKLETERDELQKKYDDRDSEFDRLEDEKRRLRHNAEVLQKELDDSLNRERELKNRSDDEVTKDEVTEDEE
jgi:uncharacterized membrane protein YciS (DUF1049 family)